MVVQHMPSSCKCFSVCVCACVTLWYCIKTATHSLESRKHSHTIAKGL